MVDRFDRNYLLNYSYLNVKRTILWYVYIPYCIIMRVYLHIKRLEIFMRRKTVLENCKKLRYIFLRYVR